LAELLSSVLAAEGADAASEAGLLLVDPGEMEALNSEHMGGTGPTDVLSFPIDGVDAAAAAVGDSSGEGVEDDAGWMVGDVVVCPEVAIRQAPGHAGEADDELRLMVVHGGLHICGWDHDDPTERGAMWDRERELMGLLGFAPAGDPWGSA
jgi:probable rRNA maturation factor